jgi:hypothetical protein
MGYHFNSSDAIPNQHTDVQKMQAVNLILGMAYATNQAIEKSYKPNADSDTILDIQLLLYYQQAEMIREICNSSIANQSCHRTCENYDDYDAP